MERDVWASALKHGVDEEDIHHALRNGLKSLLTTNEMAMVIGPARDGTILEIGLGRSGAVVHAMPARPKFWP